MGKRDFISGTIRRRALLGILKKKRGMGQHHGRFAQ